MTLRKILDVVIRSLGGALGLVICAVVGLVVYSIGLKLGLEVCLLASVAFFLAIAAFYVFRAIRDDMKRDS